MRITHWPYFDCIIDYYARRKCMTQVSSGKLRVQIWLNNTWNDIRWPINIMARQIWEYMPKILSQMLLFLLKGTVWVPLVIETKNILCTSLFNSFSFTGPNCYLFSLLSSDRLIDPPGKWHVFPYLCYYIEVYFTFGRQ